MCFEAYLKPVIIKYETWVKLKLLLTDLEG